MVDNLFPETPQSPEAAKTNDIFPSATPSDPKTVIPSDLPEEYVADLADRWAIRTYTPYQDMMTIVRNVGPGGVLRNPDNGDQSTDVVNYGFKNNLSVEDLKALYEEKTKYVQYIQASAHNKDIVESATDSNLPWKEQTAETKMAYFSAAVRDAANKQGMSKGIVGSAFDMLGMLGYEATVGIVARGTGARKTKAEDFWNRAVNATTKEEVDAIANEVVAEGASRGFLGGNSIQSSIASDAFLQGGTNVNDGPAFLLDMATIGAGPVYRGLTGLPILTGRLGALLLSRDSVDLAAVTSVKAADEALTAGIKNESKAVQFARNGSVAANRVGVTDPVNSVAPTVRPVLLNEQQNYIINSIKSSPFGSSLNREVAEEYAIKESQKFAKHSNMSYLNHVLTQYDELGTGKEINIALGKEDGTLFTTLESAEKAAKAVSGTVMQMPDKQEWFVNVTKAFSTKGMSSAIEESSMIYSIMAPVLGADVISPKDVLTLGKQGEARINYILGAMKPYTKAMKAISKKGMTEDKTRLRQFLTDLATSGRERAYSADEFEHIWFTKYGTKPNPKVTEAYTQSVYLNDARWLLQADVERSRLVDRGVEVVEFDKRGEIKVIPDYKQRVNRSELVKDLTTGEVKTAEEFAKEGKSLYTLNEDILEDGRHITYVTGDVKFTRPLQNYDALAYNPGGMLESRFDYFIRQSTKGLDLMGRVKNVMPKLIYATGSETSATKAITELNTILAKIGDLTSKSDIETFKAFRASVSQSSIDEINAVIRANNGFNPSIENLDDFIKMSEDTGLDWTSPLSIGRADQAIGDVSGLNNKLLTAYSSHRDLFKYQHNVYGDRFKTMTPYGYGESMIDPIKATEKDFLRQIHYKGQAQYLTGGVEGIIAGAEKNGVLKFNPEDLAAFKRKPVYSQIRELEGRIDTSTIIGKKYENFRQVLLRRVEEKSGVMKMYESVVNSLREKVFNKTGKQWDFFDKFNKDPVIALRGWAFDQHLGLFALDQLIVQTSQIPNMIAIAPKYATQALLDLPALRLAIESGRSDIVGAIGKNISKATSSLDAKSFEELVYYVQKSGKMNIGANIAQMDATESISYGMIQRVREAGRIPFNEGEKTARLMAVSTAYREWKAANPGLSVMTKEGMAAADSYIISRSDALTSHMTGISSSAWQRGILSLPTQFFGYTARNLEQIFLSNTLSAEERWRLGVSQFLMYGLTGTGLGWTVDKLVYSQDVSIDPDTYTLTKYGIMDWIIGELTGTRTAFAERFSLGSSVIDQFNKIQDGQFAAVAFGPVGQSGWDTGNAIFKFLYSVSTGNPTTAKMDLYKVGLNFTGFSKMSQAWIALNTGEMYTKDGRLRADGLTRGDAVAFLAGARLQSSVSQYSALELKQGEDQYIKETAARVRELRTQALKYLEAGQEADATNCFDQAGDLLRIMTPYQRTEVNKQSRLYNNSLAESLIMQLRKRYRKAMADRLQQLNNEGNQ
jgi:hypothetical protein